jgi:hypothetical protein
LGVKPVDDPHASPYANSDHAGTPEAFRQWVTGGATGGGGSNFTGSYSATASVAPPVSAPPVSAPPAASLAGSVFDAAASGALAGVTVTLSGTTTLGQAVTFTAVTGANGSYSFTGVPAGTYKVSVSPPPGYDTGSDQVGTVNGVPEGSPLSASSIGDISLTAGDSGVNYDFGENLIVTA